MKLRRERHRHARRQRVGRGQWRSGHARSRPRVGAACVCSVRWAQAASGSGWPEATLRSRPHRYGLGGGSGTEGAWGWHCTDRGERSDRRRRRRQRALVIQLGGCQRREWPRRTRERRRRDATRGGRGARGTVAVALGSARGHPFWWWRWQRARAFERRRLERHRLQVSEGRDAGVSGRRRMASIERSEVERSARRFKGRGHVQRGQTARCGAHRRRKEATRQPSRSDEWLRGACGHRSSGRGRPTKWDLRFQERQRLWRRFVFGHAGRHGSAGPREAASRSEDRCCAHTGFSGRGEQQGTTEVRIAELHGVPTFLLPNAVQ